MGGRTGETDRAYESNVDDVLVAEACRSEVDFVLRGDGDELSYAWWREERHLRWCAASRFVP